MSAHLACDVCESPSVLSPLLMCDAFFCRWKILYHIIYTNYAFQMLVLERQVTRVVNRIPLVCLVSHLCWVVMQQASSTKMSQSNASSMIQTHQHQTLIKDSRKNDKKTKKTCEPSFTIMKISETSLNLLKIVLVKKVELRRTTAFLIWINYTMRQLVWRN